MKRVNDEEDWSETTEEVRVEIEINSGGTGFLSYVSESVELRGKEVEHVHANYCHWLGLVSAAWEGRSGDIIGKRSSTSIGTGNDNYEVR